MDENGQLNAVSLLFAIGCLAVYVLINIGVFFLSRIKTGKKDENGKRTKKLSFGLLMLCALATGSLCGLALKLIWSLGVYPAFGVNAALEWINVPQQLFLNAFKLVVVPLVLISIIRSFLKVGDNKEHGKNGAVILAVLLVTVAASGAIGYSAVKLFSLNAGLLDAQAAGNEPTTLIDTILSIVPTNFFKALSSNSALPIVFLGILIAAAVAAVKKYNAEYARKFESVTEIAYEIVGTIVDIIIKFTPYGVLSIVAVQVAINDWEVFITLGSFIGAFYAGIAAIVVMHLVLLLLFGINLKQYFQKTYGTYLFAFTSMSSMATLPLTVKAQKTLGVSDETASLSATLGTCIGQNACAGLYPAMLATIAAISVGINPWTPSFALQLVLFTAISSIGVAGVGGGNIQASLLLLTMMGLPYQLFTLFLSIDFIVGLARPPVNVAGSMVAGLITQRMSDLSKKKKAKKSIET